MHRPTMSIGTTSVVVPSATLAELNLDHPLDHLERELRGSEHRQLLPEARVQRVLDALGCSGDLQRPLVVARRDGGLSLGPVVLMPGSGADDLAQRRREAARGALDAAVQLARRLVDRE